MTVQAIPRLFRGVGGVSVDFRDAGAQKERFATRVFLHWWTSSRLLFGVVPEFRLSKPT